MIVESTKYYLKKDLESYYNKIKTKNHIIDFIKNTIDFKEIHKLFNLNDKKEILKYLEKLNKKLYNLGLKLKLVESKKYFLVYIEYKIKFKNFSYYIIDICKFNKETKEFNLILPEKENLKEIEKEIQLALKLFKESLNIKRNNILNILRDYI